MRFAAILALAALAARAQAQGEPLSEARAGFPGAAPPRVPAALFPPPAPALTSLSSALRPAGTVPSAPPAPGPYAARLYDPEVEELAALLATRPPRIERSDLDGAPEALQPLSGLPGGIVLGTRARPVDAATAALLEGARLELSGREGPRLRLADGGTLALPPADPQLLASALDFLTAPGGSDALIDCLFGVVKLAPAFQGTPLARALIGADQAPHRLFPESSAWKSVIVDRAVTLEVREGMLVLLADLELRFYEERNGPARRVLTLEVLDPARGPVSGPLAGGRAPELQAALAPATELARWLGLLRWAACSDPGSLSRLEAERPRAR